ncbi:MAG: TolC family protein [Planctomycetota bacterium]|nr:TolC family protein [Planctomycetota bacterium]
MNLHGLGRLLIVTFSLAAVGCGGPAARQPQGAPPVPAPHDVAAPSQPVPSAQAAFPENPTLDDYLACAKAGNPGLGAAESKWKAAQERVPQARSLDDPRLSYRASIAKDMRIQEVVVEQMLPWFGKLDLRAAVAQQEAEALQRQYEAQALKVAYQVKNAYYEYYYLARSIDIVKQNRDLVKNLGDIALARYKAGAGGYQDVTRAQVELGKLDDQVRSLEDSRGAAAARLNAAMNRPVGAELPWPKAIPEEQGEAASDEQVLAWIAEASPELQALDHEIAREQTSIDLAKKDYWPDVGLGVGYMNQREISEGSNDNMVVGMVSVTLPIWREKYAAGVREAELRHDAALQMRADRANMLGAEVKLALYQMRDARRKMSLYRDTLVPKSRESLQATEAAFRSGQANFVDLVDARRLLLEFQLTYERMLADHAQRAAELEMLVGKQLPKTGKGDSK